MSASTSRCRVLYLTAAFPFPLSSGYLRHYHLLRELAAGHRVHLMSLTGASFDQAHTAGIEPFVDRISTFTRAPGSQGQRLRRLLEPDRAGSTEITMARAVDDEIRSGTVDVAVVSGKDTLAAAQQIIGRAPLVVDLCDATSHRLTQAIALAGPVRRAGLRIRRRGMRSIEDHLVRGGDTLITASERDRTALRDEGAPERVLDARVIPNGVDLDYWHRTTKVLGSAVVFCGNLSYGPNADAAERLVVEVMPLVWDRRPETRVTIVGMGASPSLVERLAHPLVTVTGAVDDVRPHLEGGAVFAAPLRVAAGIQNKLLEALALEVPVVTTTVAAAGLQSQGDAPPMAVTDLVVDQAIAILRQLDESVGQVPHRAGRDWVAGRFSWERSGALLASIVDELHTKERASC